MEREVKQLENIKNKVFNFIIGTNNDSNKYFIKANRQCGLTSALVNIIDYCNSNDENVLYICPNLNMAKFVKDKIKNKEAKNKFISSKCDIIGIDPFSYDLIIFDSVQFCDKYFVQEIEFKFKPTETPIVYTGVPRHGCKNENFYDFYTNYKNAVNKIEINYEYNFNEIKELAKLYTYGEFLTEVLGLFTEDCWLTYDDNTATKAINQAINFLTDLKKKYNNG